MPAEGDPATSGEKRFFALQIDVNQQGCIKFHDGRRFTTLRIQVPLHGAGPVLAAPEDVDWEFWEAEGGLLGFAQDDQEEDTDLSAVEEWNEKVCKSETCTSAGGTSQACPAILCAGTHTHMATHEHITFKIGTSSPTQATPPWYYLHVRFGTRVSSNFLKMAEDPSPRKWSVTLL